MPSHNETKWIFDHWNFVDPDEWKEQICDFYEIDEDGYDDLSDKEKYHVLSIYEEDYYEDEKSNIQALIGDNKLLCVGYAELWNGAAPGGYIADNLQDAINQLRGSDYGDIGFYQGNEPDDKDLHMTFTHHDGTNDVVVRILTDDGLDLVEEEEYNYDNPMSEPQLHKTLLDTPGFTETITVID